MFDPTQLDEAWQKRQDHQPFFCEENVLRLLQRGELPDDAAALWIGNRDRTVAMWGQRAARHDPIVWDYHVVVALRSEQLIVDLDARDRVAWPLRSWLAHAFRPVEPEFRPQFRIVPRKEMLQHFSSDRSHMLGPDGRRLQPFPAWPAPFDPALGHTLPRFVDMRAMSFGTITDALGLMAWADAGAREPREGSR